MPAIELHCLLKSSELLETAHHCVREFVIFAEEDSIFDEDINKVAGIINDFYFENDVTEFAKGKGINL